MRQPRGQMVRVGFDARPPGVPVFRSRNGRLWVPAGWMGPPHARHIRWAPYSVTPLKV